MANEDKYKTLPVSHVQITATAAMYIVKHVQCEGGIGESAQGFLLGYRDENKDYVEVTKIVPKLRVSPADFEDQRKEKPLRHKQECLEMAAQQSYDTLDVGFYESSNFGPNIYLALFERQMLKQKLMDESVVILYDPVRTSQGQLHLKAFRLGDSTLEMVRNNKDFGITDIKNSHSSFSELFIELPVQITTSNLLNVCLSEIELASPSRHDRPFLTLKSTQLQEKHLGYLSESTDREIIENQRLCMIHDQVRKSQFNRAKQIQFKNEERRRAGLDELTEEQINALFTPLHDPPRGRQFVAAAQVKQHVDRVQQYASQSLSKMQMVDALQGKLVEASSTFLTQLHKEITDAPNEDV